MRLIALCIPLFSVACGTGGPPSSPPPTPAPTTGLHPIVPPTAPATGTTDEPARDDAFERHLAALRKRAPAGFHVVAQPPFAVVGNESVDRVRRHATGTVKWSVDHLKQSYFDKDPERILDVWLFKDAATYNKYTKEIFNDDPGTPYGYYSSTHGALIMNIGTGGGTLVHEIVHPFIEANFPACPAWFNEGLGSLYEQSGERNGQIIGRTNWRLAGLQSAIRRGNLSSFRTLTGTTEAEFYGDNSGTNYAQARYLLYYLQEQGLLRRFYKQFHKDQRADPTGYRTLEAILDRNDMKAFQNEWEAYVLKLRFG